MIYLPIFQRGWPNFVVARVTGDPMGFIAALRREMRAIDPKLPVVDINTLDALMDASLVQERLIATLSGFFGLLALMLSSVGLYGVMSYTVSRRTTEIGIRLALGAQPRDLRRLVLRETLLLALSGIVIGLPAALAVTRLARCLLFGLSSVGPSSFVWY